jgi:hypothetical protein
MSSSPGCNDELLRFFVCLETLLKNLKIDNNCKMISKPMAVGMPINIR